MENSDRQTGRRIYPETKLKHLIITPKQDCGDFYSESNMLSFMKITDSIFLDLLSFYFVDNTGCPNKYNGLKGEVLV